MMKRFLFFFILLVTGPLLYGQMLLDTMWFDTDWKQSAPSEAAYYRLVKADTSRQVRFLIEDYFLDGKPQMEGTYTSINPDVKNGSFVYYFHDGNKRMECVFVNNAMEGLVKEWYMNGNPKSEISYHNQQLNGPYRVWSENAIPQLDIHYRNSDLDGKFISYYPSGQIVREDYYVKGEIRKKHCYTRDGRDTTWFPYIEMPEFPGGKEKFMWFIDNQIAYPAEALKQRLQGRVDIQFSVEPNGRVIKVAVARSTRDVFNEEAVRVISSSPRWKPGRKDGEAVEVTMTIPVWFKIR